MPGDGGAFGWLGNAILAGTLIVPTVCLEVHIDEDGEI